LSYAFLLFFLQQIGVEEVCKRLNGMVEEAKQNAGIPQTTKLNSLVGFCHNF